MEPHLLGSALRTWREKAGLGPIKSACATFGISHSTLGMYERGELLPDVDFLAIFAARTGANFHALLRMRLADSETREARNLAQEFEGAQGADKPEKPAAVKEFHPDDALREVAQTFKESRVYVSPRLLGKVAEAVRQICTEATTSDEMSDLILLTHGIFLSVAKRDEERLKKVTVEDAVSVMRIVQKLK